MFVYINFWFFLVGHSFALLLIHLASARVCSESEFVEKWFVKNWAKLEPSEWKLIYEFILLEQLLMIWSAANLVGSSFYGKY